jgi:hypothetical protein
MAVEGTQGGRDWASGLLRPVLIAGMVACLASPLVLFLEQILPYWDGTYLLFFSFFASLEGILSERLLRRQRITGWGYLASRAAELLFLLLALKLVSYISFGLDQLWYEAQRWPVDPDTIVTDVDLVTSLVFVPIWLGSLSVAGLASEIEGEGQVLEAPPDRDSAAYYEWLTQPSPVLDRQERLDTLGQLFVWGGVMLLAASAFVHAFMASVQVLALPVLLYFALGIALLSQARYSVTVTGWRLQGIPVEPKLGRRWLAWALVFLLGVALVALMLPTRYFMGPLLALWSAFDLIYRAILTVLLFLFYLLMSLLSLLLPSIPPPEEPAVPLQPLPMPETPPAASGGLAWLQIIGSVVFWATIVLIVVYALYRFVRDRRDLLEGGERAPATWWGRLLAWLRGVWRRWRAWQRGVTQQLAERRASRRRQGGIVQRLLGLSLRGLSPRELVRYFYLSAARRAGDAGQARRPGQTPYEYQQSLQEQFPELEPDLTGLTDAFVIARYTAEPVEAEDAQAVKPLWHRIKVMLRQRRLLR